MLVVCCSPPQCTHTSRHDTPRAKTCYLPPPRPLRAPSLWLSRVVRLSHHGRQFYIPLSSLLLDAEGEEIDEDESPDPDGGTTGSTTTNANGGDRRLCVTREGSIRGVREPCPAVAAVAAGRLFQLQSAGIVVQRYFSILYPRVFSGWLSNSSVLMLGVVR